MVWERDHKRREFLKLAAFSLAGLTTTGARGLGQAQREAIQRPDTPERALSLLVEGNQRFVAQNLISFKEDLDILKAHSEGHQEPFRRCALVRGLAGAGGICVRSEHWSPVCGAGGRQCGYSGYHRQSRVRCGGIGRQGDRDARPHQLRCGESDHGRQGGTRGRLALCINIFILQSRGPRVT